MARTPSLWRSRLEEAEGCIYVYMCVCVCCNVNQYKGDFLRSVHEVEFDLATANEGERGCVGVLGRALKIAMSSSCLVLQRGRRWKVRCSEWRAGSRILNNEIAFVKDKSILWFWESSWWNVTVWVCRKGCAFGGLRGANERGFILVGHGDWEGSASLCWGDSCRSRCGSWWCLWGHENTQHEVGRTGDAAGRFWCPGPAFWPCRQQAAETAVRNLPSCLLLWEVCVQNWSHPF